MGTADVKGSFHKGTYELSVSTYMMCIMMLFNEKDTLSLDEIRHHTNIPEDELRRGILSLCTQKHRILRKSSKKRGIEDGDVFTFNKDYESRLRRIRVPLVAMKEVKPAGKSKLSLDRENSSSSNYLGRGLSIESNDGSVMDVSQVLQDDRRHTLEAVVVRIMKARRSLSHNDLVSEVIKQVHLFTPSPMDIKGRIESLIDREYIERDSTDRKMYTYLT
jgi:cullin 3